MIQLNLLPDVKMQYIKAQRTRNMVLSTAILVSLASVGLLIMLLLVGGLQKKHISDLNKDIKADIATLQGKPDIEKILTVQNQLNRLTELHSSKPAAANVFIFLNEVTPSQASINEFKIDFTNQTVSITGTADSLSTVNKYVDTLKYTTYTTEGSNKQVPAFKDVVLSNFTLASNPKSPKQSATYTITLTYDPVIFDITQTVKLTVPSITTTRAQLDKSSDLFTAPSGGSSSSGGN